MYETNFLHDEINYKYQFLTPKVYLTHSFEKRFPEIQIIDYKINGYYFFPPKYSFGLKKILLSDIYLSHLWGLCFFCFSSEEISQEVQNNNSSTQWLNLHDTEITKQGLELLKHSIELSKDNNTKKWPNNCCKPSFANSSKSDIRTFCAQTDHLFTSAIAFFLFHELGHKQLEHDDVALLLERISNGYVPTEGEKAMIVEAESDADNYAFDMIFDESMDKDNKFNISYGVILALLANLFTNSGLLGIKQKYHPNLHERISRALQKIDALNISDADYFYHLVSQIIIYFLQCQTTINFTYGTLDSQNRQKDFCEKVLSFVDLLIETPSEVLNKSVSITPDSISIDEVDEN